jgi:hypothetical protein
MVVLLEVSPIHRGTLERCLGHLSDQGPTPRIAQLGRAAISGKSLYWFQTSSILRMMEATVFLGTFIAAEHFWNPSLDLCLNTILSRSSTDNSFDLMAWFLLSHALSTVGPYRQVCAFPNHVQSIAFTAGGLQ